MPEFLKRLNLKMVRYLAPCFIDLPSDSSDFGGFWEDWLMISELAVISIEGEVAEGLLSVFSAFEFEVLELSLFVESIRSKTSAWTGFWRCIMSSHLVIVREMRIGEVLPRSFGSPWSPFSTTVGVEDSADDWRTRSVLPLEFFLAGS